MKTKKRRTIRRSEIAQIINDLGAWQTDDARYLRANMLASNPSLMRFFIRISAATSNLDNAWKGEPVLSEEEMVKHLTGEK